MLYVVVWPANLNQPLKNFNLFKKFNLKNVFSHIFFTRLTFHIPDYLRQDIVKCELLVEETRRHESGGIHDQDVEFCQHDSDWSTWRLRFVGLQADWLVKVRFQRKKIQKNPHTNKFFQTLHFI